MPGQDRTGPCGQGPLTGRGLGPCGQGQSFRRGFGFGRGFGFRAQSVELSNDEKKKILEAEKEEIEKELKTLKAK